MRLPSMLSQLQTWRLVGRGFLPKDHYRLKETNLSLMNLHHFLENSTSKFRGRIESSYWTQLVGYTPQVCKPCSCPAERQQQRHQQKVLEQPPTRDGNQRRRSKGEKEATINRWNWCQVGSSVTQETSGRGRGKHIGSYLLSLLNKRIG